MSPLQPLQIGAFVPTIPPGLGAAVVVIGLTIMVGAYTRITMQELSSQSERIYGIGLEDRQLAAWSFGTGILFLTIGALQRYQLVVPYVALLYLVGNMISGVAHVRFWKKIEMLLRKQEFTGDLARTVKYGLASMFVVIIVGSMFVWLVLSAPFSAPLAVQFAFAWTLLVLGLSIVGLSKRALPLRTQLDNKLIYGFILTIAGSEIFDLTLAGNVGFLLVGSIGYSIGFWVAVYYWLFG